MQGEADRLLLAQIHQDRQIHQREAGRQLFRIVFDEGKTYPGAATGQALQIRQ